MSTPETTPPPASSAPPSSMTPSPQSPPASSSTPPPAAAAPPAAKPGDTPPPSKDTPPPAAKDAPPAEGDLLFDKNKKPGDQPPAQKPDAAGQREYLKTKVDPKTLEGKSDEDIAKLFDEQKAAEAADANKPIEYTDFDLSKAPEGVDLPADQLEWLKQYGAENKLTQEQAQTLVNKGIEMQQKNLDFWNETKKGWRYQVKKDPELGGHNLEKSVDAAEKIVARFGGTPEQIKEMQDDLQLLGLGNKRSFIRFCNNIHKLTADDSAGGNPGSGGSQEKSLAMRMWGNMPGDKK